MSNLWLVAGVAMAKGMVASPTMAKPATVTDLAPIRSVSHPASERLKNVPIPWGTSSRPAISGSAPRTSCQYRGRSSIAPYSDAPDRRARRTPMRPVGV